MKAVVLNEFGPPSNLKVASLPDPKPGPGELLLAVEATSVNPVDTKIRSGALKAISPPLPGVLHGDVVGVVRAVGAGVENYRVGDRVWACGGGVRGSDGALAELMRVDARLAAPAPGKLAAAGAAALPLVAITAWEAVVERANVRPGMRVLVHGGSGGVGHVAVQLARIAGAEVTATVSTEDKAAVARELGAHVVAIGRDGAKGEFDVVIDTIGGANVGLSMGQIALHGKVVTIAARTTADLSPLHARAGSLDVVFMLLPLLTRKGREAHGEILRKTAALVDAGQLRPLIAARFPFAEASVAHETLEAGKHVGKIVISGW